MRSSQHSSAAQYTGGLSRGQFFAIVGLFWMYVTVTNVLFAYGMRTGISVKTNMPLFAPWDARVTQHLLLLPFLIVSYWASLRIQWRPVLFAIPLQLVLAAAFAVIAYPAMIVAEMTVGGAAWNHEMADHATMHPWSDPYFLSLWLASFVNFLPSYGFGLALVTGLALYTRFRDSEVKRAALEHEWSAARLSALRMQLSPHTLFNLLHTIRGLIGWDPKAAQHMVVQLADLLRRLLNAGERDYSRLGDELQFVRLYLELQQRRFADRLTVVLPPVGEFGEFWVPSLILQPLVENAVVHGLAGHQGPVIVRVSVEKGHETLILRVTNTIAAAKSHNSDAIGLTNVRERLAVQFDGRGALFAGPSGTEWISEITLPEIRGSPEKAEPARGTPLAKAS